MKKYMILFDGSKPVIAKNLCTVYYISTYPNSARYIDLYNLSYAKSKDLFVFSKFINLPKRLILRYKNTCDNVDELIKEMEAIGILNFEVVNKKIKSFEDKKDLLEYNSYKDKILKRKNDRAISLKLIEEINSLREELISTYANNETVLEK